MEGSETKKQSVLTGNLKQDMAYLNDLLGVGTSFDVICREISFAGKDACMYLIDGFCKDELMQKLLQFFMDMTPDKMPADMEELSGSFTPYVEVEVEEKIDAVVRSLLSGVFVLLVDGFGSAFLIDSRTYPARSVEEPEKDKVLRGSRDGFVETIVFNTALIRRRIRSTDLRMEMMSAGKSSRTDIVLCYMNGRADEKFLHEIRRKIQNIAVDALSMNQESLAECL